MRLLQINGKEGYMREFLKKSANALSIELTDEMLEKFQTYFDFQQIYLLKK